MRRKGKEREERIEPEEEPGTVLVPAVPESEPRKEPEKAGA